MWEGWENLSVPITFSIYYWLLPWSKTKKFTQTQDTIHVFSSPFYRLLFETNVTKVISKNVLVKSSEKTLFFYLYFTWLCGSWKLKRILKNKPFWKYDSWFPSEESNFTSVRNMLDLSLKYWFMKAKNVFWICYGPKK